MKQDLLMGGSLALLCWGLAACMGWLVKVAIDAEMNWGVAAFAASVSLGGLGAGFYILIDSIKEIFF